MLTREQIVTLRQFAIDDDIEGAYAFVERLLGKPGETEASREILINLCNMAIASLAQADAAGQTNAAPGGGEGLVERLDRIFGNYIHHSLLDS